MSMIGFKRPQTRDEIASQLSMREAIAEMQAPQLEKQSTPYTSQELKRFRAIDEEIAEREDSMLITAMTQTTVVPVAKPVIQYDYENLDAEYAARSEIVGLGLHVTNRP